jgi:hypothetical protein
MVIEWPWRSCQPERRDAQRWAAHTDVDVTFDADLDFLVSAPDVLSFRLTLATTGSGVASSGEGGGPFH